MLANLWMGFDDRAQSTGRFPDDDGNLPIPNEALGDPSVRGIFRIDNEPGPRNYELWSLYYEVADWNELLQIRNTLLVRYPGQLRTIGSWWFNTGEQIIRDESPFDALFPQHTSILEYIPDVDDIGTRPVVITDVNLGMGQAVRVFT